MKKYIVYGEPGIPAKRVALLYGVNLKECILVPYYDIKSILGLDKSKYIELYPDITDKYDLKETKLNNLGIHKKLSLINNKTKEIEVKSLIDALGVSFFNFTFDLSKELSIVKDEELKTTEEILKELSEDIEKILEEKWSD